jgi:hypothetical protein
VVTRSLLENTACQAEGILNPFANSEVHTRVYGGGGYWTVRIDERTSHPRIVCGAASQRHQPDPPCAWVEQPRRTGLFRQRGGLWLDTNVEPSRDLLPRLRPATRPRGCSMTSDIEVLTDERVAALVKCMQSRVQRGAASRYYFSLAFEGLAVSPSAWDTLSLVQTEMDKAGKHLYLAYEAVTGWLLRGARTSPPLPDTRSRSR